MIRLCFVVMAIVCLSMPGYAQSTTASSIHGVINDKANEAVSGATVRATHLPTGTVFGAITRTNGAYRIVNMKVGGPYIIVVSSVGKATTSYTLEYLRLGEDATVSLTLADSTVDMKAVEVTALSASQATKTGPEDYVSTQQLSSFPSITRNYQEFARFSPYATPQTGTSSVTLGGRNSKFNNLQVDGTQYNDLFGLGETGSPGGQANSNPISMDAIQELQVLVAPFDVRQGRFSAGGMNAVTRSGTNTWQGSAYYYFRNEQMIGDLHTTTALSTDEQGNPLPLGTYRDTTIATPFADFSEYQLGARVGGPLIDNKLFMFFSAEQTQRKNPNPQLGFIQNGSNNSLIRSIADTMGQILRDVYGYDPGAMDNVESTRPSLKLFGRIDWNLDNNNTITFRHNYVDASDEIYNPNRTTVLFGNRMYTNTSQTNSSVLQWHSTLSPTMHNELIAGATLIRDHRDIHGARWPSVTVTDSRTSGVYYTAGAENFSLANVANTNVFELTDNFTFFMDDHTFTVGTQNEFLSFRNLFIRDNAGTWTFNSLDDFRNGFASRLQYSFARPQYPADFAAEFSTAQLGFYAQDEWQVNPQLRLTMGVRVDMPLFFDSPNYNVTADTIHYNANTNAALLNPNATLGVRTDNMPGLNPLFSPRVGFNWTDGESTPLTIRGGVGLFSGRVPFVWIANQFANSGLEYARVDLRQSGSDTLRFDPTLDPRSNPDFVARAGKVTEVDVTATDFRMPQNLRVNLAAERELAWGIVGTIEGMYSKTLNDIYYTDLNLGDRQDTTPYGGTLPGGRGVYGTYSGRNTTPRTQVGSFGGGPFNNIIQLGNTSEGYTYSISAQLKKQFNSGWFASVAYTHSASYDRNSGMSSQAISNWRYNYTQDSPNDVALSRSLYDMPHRFIAAISKRFEYGSSDNPFATSVSLFYELRSGQPFSYVYDGDINADGQTENDLIYIPQNRTDIVLGTFSKSDSLQLAAPTMYDQLDAYIERDAYLSANRGKIAERFGARQPMVQTLDLRLLQEIPNPVAKGHRLDITVDILNLLNLLNPDWGRIQTAAYNQDKILRFQGLVTTNTKQDPNAQQATAGTPVFTYTDKRDPFGYNNMASRYQIQIGIRYNF
ncbi:MAG: TonB-dependent receptor [Bradyrhizobiaceae bacterium]|nr:TonB-dependent receptor [Bradyrhizobiaceae bacterium]